MFKSITSQIDSNSFQERSLEIGFVGSDHNISFLGNLSPASFARNFQVDTNITRAYVCTQANS